jgi:hypothetical protein
LLIDETAASTSGPELMPVIEKAKTELEKIGVWFRANKMAVNVSKTKFIISKSFSLFILPPIVYFKGIVSPDWKGLQMVSLDRFEV